VTHVKTAKINFITSWAVVIIRAAYYIDEVGKHYFRMLPELN